MSSEIDDANSSSRQDPVGLWQEIVGDPLINALKWIDLWRKEATGGRTRELTYQEFCFRANGHLTFDGKVYRLTEGLAEVIAQMGSEGLIRADSKTALAKNLVPVPALHYELARHIARTNRAVGLELPKSLRVYADDTAQDLQRGKGGDQEKRILFRHLAWWATDRAVKLGLKVDRSRASNEATQCAAQLVADAFFAASLGNEFTYNSVIAAWEAHRHTGSDQRKLKIKIHNAAYQRHFFELDELVGKLSLFETR